MGNSTSVSLGFKSKEFTSEVKNITTSLKSAQKEFKTTDTILQSNGTKLQQIENKYKSLGNQMKLQQQLTEKYKQAVTQASDAQEKAKSRLEKANKAYEEGKKNLKGNSDELKKLKDEVTKSEKAVNTATNQYTKYNDKLNDSKTAEAKLQNEIKTTNEAMKKQSTYVAQVNEKFTQLQAKTKGVRDGMSTVGSAMTKGVTLPIVAGITASVAAFKEVDDGMDTVIAKTGATGDAAKDLQQIYKNVSSTMPQDFGDIGAAIGELNTRLEFTGNKLQVASIDFLKFAEVNGTDVNTSVQLVTRAMGDAGIESGNYKELLDMLTVASQKSGISIDSLATNLAKYGAPMRALGIDTKNSISLFAAWEKAGVNTEIAFSGMKKAISNWGKAGKDSSKEFSKTMEQIKNAPTLAAATTKAIEVFGAKAGPDLADAIKGGRFEVTEYMKALEQCGGAVSNTYEGMEDDDVKFTLAMHNLKLAFSEMGETVLTTAAPILQDLTEIIKNGAKSFDGMSESQKSNILKWLALAAAIGPVLSIGSKAITVFNGVSSATSTLGTVVGKAVGSSSTGLGGFGAALAAIPAPAKIAIGAVTGLTIAGIEIYKAYKNSQYQLEHFGEAAKESGKKYEKAFENNKNVKEQSKALNDLTWSIDNGKLSADALKEAQSKRKEVEKWFIDNYGEYISAEEKKNGITEESTKKIEENTKAKLNNSLSELKLDVSTGKNEAKKANETYGKKEDENKGLIKTREEAIKTQTVLSDLQNEWISFNETTRTQDEKMAESQRLLQKAIKKTKISKEDFTFDDNGNAIDAISGIARQLSKTSTEFDYADEKIKKNNESMKNLVNTSSDWYNEAKRVVEIEELGGETFESATNNLTWYNNQMKALKKNGKESTPEYMELKNAFDKLSPKVDAAGNKIIGLNEELSNIPESKKTDVKALTKEAENNLDVVKGKTDNLPNSKTIKINVDISQALNSFSIVSSEFSKMADKMAKNKAVKVGGNAKGTKNADPGLSVVNEEGSELIEKPNGEFYMAQGSPALVNLEAGDKVYTADETKRMYSELPHFADGKSAYETAKSTFDHKKATSEVSVSDQLAWWKNVLAEFGNDADAVKEAEEEIYSLTKELSEKQNEDFKTNLDTQLELSKKYIDDCLHSANWGSDSLEKAFDRVKSRYDEALKDGKITIDEYNSSISDLKNTISDNSQEYSQNWLDNMSKYGLIDDNQYIQGLQRMLQNSKKLYDKGIIDYREYAQQTNEINGQIYDKRMSMAEKYFNDYYDEKSKAVNDYYDSLDKADTESERSDNLEQLYAQQKIYANAVTKEGKAKLKEIQNNIASIKKEQEKAQRDEEKQAKLDAIETEKTATLAGLSKYVSEVTGVYGQANEESAKEFDKLIQNASKQQEELAKQGYENVHKYVAMAQADIARVNKIFGQVVNNNTSNTTTLNQYQTNNNIINDSTDAEIFGNAASNAFMRYANPYLLKR